MRNLFWFLVAAVALIVLAASCATNPGGEIAASTQDPSVDRESRTMTIEPTELTGMWQGILKAGGQELRLVFHFDYRDGVYNATMDSPDQGAKGVPVDSVSVDGRSIRADLTVPAGPGPFPAVVLVSGSGAQNRDEELMNHRPFLVLADYLTRRDIAVLRYDDRGVAPSEGDASTATSTDLAGDAWAAFTFLSAQPKIDAANIGIAGHSEGGIIAPMVASSHPEVAFIVLMAGPGFRGYDLVLQQSAAILRASGASEDQIAQAAAINRRLYDVVLGQSDEEKAIAELQEIMAEAGMPKEQADAQLMGLMSPWYRHFLAFDPATVLRKTKCPVLAIGGSKDLQVPATENLAAIERAVRDGGNTRVETVELEGLNHLFQHATTGLVQEYAQIEETFAPVALETIGDWILEVTHRE